MRLYLQWLNIFEEIKVNMHHFISFFCCKHLSEDYSALKVIIFMQNV
jgi:hypothetical protein